MHSSSGKPEDWKKNPIKKLLILGDDAQHLEDKEIGKYKINLVPFPIPRRVNDN